MLAGLLTASLGSSAAIAQSVLDGTWKLDLGALPAPKGPYVWLLKGGVYQCKSCVPPIRVQADGRDQKVLGQSYDTLSVSILGDRTVRLIEKKSGRTVSDETFEVSDDGKTATDEFAGWKVSMWRLAEGPGGSHALSGSWQPLKIESVSDEALLITYRLEGDILKMVRPTGQSYSAKLDGSDAPYKGDPNITAVSVRRVDANTIEETDKFKSKVLNVVRTTVDPDGKSMSIVITNIQSGTATRLTAWRK